MKIILSIFLSIFLSKSCAQDQELSEVKVVYGANTRGYHRMITIEKNTFSLVSQRDGKPSVIVLTDEQWKKIADLYGRIDLKTFNDLEGPTMERAYDGKPHADMSIIVKDKTYTTKGFDHTIPPVKIKEFVDYINKIADDSVLKNPILGSYVVEELVNKNVSEKGYFISFDKEKVSGFMGCNMFSGSYKTNLESITFSALVSTRKYCENEMENENLWLKSVSEITSFSIDGKSVLLFNNQGKLILKATKK
jgi:heat shock protein HslJ